MKSIITAIITCLILFGISVGTTKFFLAPPAEETADSAEAMLDESATPEEENTEVRAMPVSLRPDNSVSIEAVIQMSDSINKMEQELVAREERLAKKERRVQLLFDDLTTEQDEIRAFSEGIDAKLEMLSRLRDTVKSSLDELDSKKSALEELAKQTGSDEQSQQKELDNRVEDVKGWFANLEPEQAADYLKEFANNGKLQFAASLLQKMPDRQKSKILGVMSDPILVEQLIDSL